MRIPILSATLLAAGLIGGVGARAQTNWSWDPQPRVAEDRLGVELSALWTSFTSDARVDEDAASPGTPFNAEDDLGLNETRLVPLPELTLRPGKRHLLRLTTLQVNRTGRKILDRDILYDGILYEEGALVDSKLDLSMYGVTYGYRFLDGQRYKLTGTFGIQIVDFKNNAEIRSLFSREETGDTAPVPLLGLEGQIDINKRWSVEARAQYTRVELDLIEGRVLDARLAATWQVNPHLALGLGYRLLQIRADSIDDDSAGFVDLEMSGPVLFVRAGI